MGVVRSCRRGFRNDAYILGRCIQDARFTVLEYDLLSCGQSGRTEERDRTMEEEQLKEVVSMLSVLAEAVLFGWDNVADIAREAAKMVADIKND